MKKIHWIAGILILFLGFSVFPLRNLIFSDFLWKNHLVILTNESESRPCGGFVTAFGEVRAFPPRIWLKNSYALESFSFGKNEFPLDRIALEKKFWDLGDSVDIRACGDSFLKAYNTSLGEELENFVLVNFSVLEDIVGITGSLKINNQRVQRENFFEVLSRAIADIDRHDEKVLGNRKSVLKTITKKLILKTTFQPWKWFEISRSINKSIANGGLFISGFSKNYKPTEESFGVIEWNLGGGKSSRSLRKHAQLSLREIKPSKWNIVFDFSAENLAGQDEPIGQTWKGGFEYRVPESIGDNIGLEFIEIPPGEIFQEQFIYEYSGDITDLEWFKQRGQDISLDLRVSVYPQQYITSDDLLVRGNTALWYDFVSQPVQKFSWKKISDKISPFLTLHQRVQSDVFAQNFIVELHFNEPVVVNSDLRATLVDRDYTNTDITENMEAVDFLLLDNKTTLLLGFDQQFPQIEERFFLELEGIEDLFGNKFITKKNTVIDR